MTEPSARLTPLEVEPISLTLDALSRTLGSRARAEWQGWLMGERREGDERHGSQRRPLSQHL